MLLWWWNFDFIIQRNFMNKCFFFTLSQLGEVISSSSDWITFCHKRFELFAASLCWGYFWLSDVAITEMHRERERGRASDGCQRQRGAHRTPPAGSVWDLGPWGPLDGSLWMGALARWPGSLRTGYEGKGMLLLCVWPPDPLSNVCLGSFETQHIYLQRSEERGWSGCQNKVIVLLTASSAVEGQLWQAHNVAASASPGRRTVICGHAGNLATVSPPSPLPWYTRIISLAPLEMFFISMCRDVNWVTCGNSPLLCISALMLILLFLSLSYCVWEKR